MSEYSTYLRFLTYQGALRRFPGYPLDMPEEEWVVFESVAPMGDSTFEIKSRLESELSVINATGYPSYFLIVQDLIAWCRKNDIPVGPGRGSVSGSLVAYCLGITDVNPIEHRIPFERFLHSERIGMPDIDVDVCWQRRPQAIDYLRKKYGEDHVAEIVVFSTMQAKAVITDVARVGHWHEQVYGGFQSGQQLLGVELASLVPDDSPGLAVLLEIEEGKPLKDRLNSLRGLIFHPCNCKSCVSKRRGGAVPREQQREIDPFDSIRKLEGLKRHGSSHSGGIVIGNRPLIEIAPLFRRGKTHAQRNVQIQFEYEDAETIGLLKMDVLGLRTVSVMGDCEREIRKRMVALAEDTGIVHLGDEWKLSSIPLDDDLTFQLLREGKTRGVFQLEGEGITQAMMSIKPTTFDDVPALLALYRPGPMDQIPEYAARKIGKNPVKDWHPDLSELLSRTFGLLVYQEQVMGITQIMGGYSPGQADVFRKAIGKKIPELLTEQIEGWKEAALKRGYTKDLVDELAGQIAHYGRYGFNQAHAYGYGYITYWTAWLKANFPTIFYWALLNNYIDKAERTAQILQDAKSQGIKLLPPDINRAAEHFALSDDDSIMFGLSAVKGIGKKSVEAILEERDENGLFKDLNDFCRRLTRVNVRAKRALVAAGAFGTGLKMRRTCLAQIEIINKTAKANIDREWTSEALTEREVFDMEREAMGFYVSGHPFDSIRSYFPFYGVSEAESFDELPNACMVAGVVSRLKTHRSKKGMMAFVGIETDIEGMPDVTVFPDTWAQYHNDLGIGQLVFIHGVKSEFRDKAGFNITKVMPIDDPENLPGSEIYVVVPEPMELRSSLRLGRQGAQFYALVPVGANFALIETSYRMKLTPDGIDPLLETGVPAWINHRGGLRRVKDPHASRPKVWEQPHVKEICRHLNGKVTAELYRL